MAVAKSGNHPGVYGVRASHTATAGRKPPPKARKPVVDEDEDEEEEDEDLELEEQEDGDDADEQDETEDDDSDDDDDQDEEEADEPMTQTATAPRSASSSLERPTPRPQWQPPATAPSRPVIEGSGEELLPASGDFGAMLIKLGGRPAHEIAFVIEQAQRVAALEQQLAEARSVLAQALEGKVVPQLPAPRRPMMSAGGSIEELLLAFMNKQLNGRAMLDDMAAAIPSAKRGSIGATANRLMHEGKLVSRGRGDYQLPEYVGKGG